MTYLGYGFFNGEIQVMQDTLALTAKDRSPFLCLEKFKYFPKLNCVIAGTGDVYIQMNSWIKAWNTSSIDSLIEEIPIALAEYRKSVIKINQELAHSTVFLFFFEEGKPKGLRFTYSSEGLTPSIIDISENLQEGRIAHKPGDLELHAEYMSQTDKENFKELHKGTYSKLKELETCTNPSLETELLAYGLLNHLADCSLSRLERLGIGGDFIFVSFNRERITKYKKVLVFPDNKSHAFPEKLLSTDEAYAKLQEDPVV